MKVKVQYWAPITKYKNASEADVYKDCWRKSWRCNAKDLQIWEHVSSSIVWSWTLRTKNASSIESEKSILRKTIKIPKSVVEKAKLSLNLAGCVHDDNALDCNENTLED